MKLYNVPERPRTRRSRQNNLLKLRGRHENFHTETLSLKKKCFNRRPCVQNVLLRWKVKELERLENQCAIKIPSRDKQHLEIHNTRYKGTAHNRKHNVKLNRTNLQLRSFISIINTYNNFSLDTLAAGHLSASLPRIKFLPVKGRPKYLPSSSNIIERKVSCEMPSPKFIKCDSLGVSAIKFERNPLVNHSGENKRNSVASFKVKKNNKYEKFRKHDNCIRTRKYNVSTKLLSVFLILALTSIAQITSAGKAKEVDKIEKSDKENKSLKDKMVKIPGDVIFGGLFPMHERGPNKTEPCGQIKEEKGIQRMEAMLYALDEINSDPELLPNITLGALILDTCSSDTYALEQSVEFFRSSLSTDKSQFKCKGGQKPIVIPPKPVVGVIGAASSAVSVMVANILRLFQIPQISYASTSTELSDKSRFEFFSRVVPPDNFQAMAMVEVVKTLGWKYVSTVSVEGGYGEKGIASFIQLASKAGLCVAVSETISRKMSQPEEFDDLIARLLTKPQARAVVMFVDEDNTRKLITAVTKADKIGHFLWIGSDSWGAKIHPVKDQEESAEGAITILPQRTSLKGFDNYFRSLKPKFRNKKECEELVEGSLVKRNCRNVWFKEFWTKHFNCTFKNYTEGRNECTGEENINTEQEGLVPFVVDAVYALAYAYHDLILDKCGNMSLCSKVIPPPPGPEVLHYIRSVNFVGKQKRRIKFNKDGDAPGSYFIFQYQRLPNTSTYEYVRIGNWTESLELDRSKLYWTKLQLRNKTEFPESICSQPCPQGYIRNFQDQCCWGCVPCPEHCIVNNDTCEPCDLGWAPTPDKVTCYKLTPEHITWESPWALVPVIFSGLGLMCTLLTAITFMRFNTTPIIMASGRELCYVLLVGIALCYLMTFIILAPPTKTICILLRLGLGLGLCICYSAIFTKTNRISRIFNRKRTSIQRPSYTSPKSQIIICLGLVVCQLAGVVAWLVVETPATKEVYPYRLVAVLTCGTSNVTFILSLGYNMILILLCTVYAFKTRKIPENFNEAKYIGFTMYSTCIVWLAFVPIYFSTTNDYKIQLASICMCVNISASVPLGCLFTPKVYIVIFQPYKNVRQGSGQGKGSSTNKNYGTSMRFQQRSQTAQSVLSANHSAAGATPPTPSLVPPQSASLPCPPPTISQQVRVNGESLTAATITVKRMPGQSGAIT